MTAKKKTSTRSTKETQLKKQLDQISAKVLTFERNAEKQIKEIVKISEQARQEQMKRVQGLIKEAGHLDSKRIVTHAEKLKKDLEKRTNLGVESVLKRFHIPTKKEFDSLKRKVSTLEKKVKEQEHPKKTGASTRSKAV